MNMTQRLDLWGRIGVVGRAADTGGERLGPPWLGRCQRRPGGRGLGARRSGRGERGPRGDGWAHRGYYGGVTHTDFVGVHNTYVGGYHPGGCYNCGAAAAAVGGLAVGAMAGAAIADASQPATTVVVNQGSTVPLGTHLSSLPGGCKKMKVNSTLYYQCGSTWYKPGFGDSGVYYQVVPVP